MTAAVFIDIVFPLNRASSQSSPHFLAERGFAFRRGSWIGCPEPANHEQPGDRNRRRTAPLYSLRGGIPALASTWPGIGPIWPPAVPAFGCFHASSPGLRSSLWEVDSWGEPRIGSCLIQHGEQLLGRLPCRLRFRFVPTLPRLVCASWRGRAVPIGPAVSRSRRRMAVAEIYDGARARTRPGPAPPECRSRATGCSASTPRGPMVS